MFYLLFNVIVLRFLDCSVRYVHPSIPNRSNSLFDLKGLLGCHRFARANIRFDYRHYQVKMVLWILALHILRIHRKHQRHLPSPIHFF